MTGVLSGLTLTTGSNQTEAVAFHSFVDPRHYPIHTVATIQLASVLKNGVFKQEKRRERERAEGGGGGRGHGEGGGGGEFMSRQRGVRVVSPSEWGQSGITVRVTKSKDEWYHRQRDEVQGGMVSPSE